MYRMLSWRQSILDVQLLMPSSELTAEGAGLVHAAQC